MKAFIILLTLLTSTIAFSKTLTVDCSGGEGKSLKMVSEIVNINSPQKIKKLSVNGVSQTSFRDVSTLPAYKDGTITLKVQYGK